MSKTWKIVLGTLLYTAFTAAAVAYFYFAGELVDREKPSLICKHIDVSLLDSSINKFITKKEITDVIDHFCGGVIGKRIDSINLAQIEALLNHRSVVKESQAFITRDGTMHIEILQRKPILRIEIEHGGFYVDETAYIFPLVTNNPSYVPVFTGNIPIEMLSNQSEVKDSLSCINKILQMGLYLQKHPFWNAQVEEVFFNSASDVELVTRVGNQRIIFGNLDNIDDKFSRLYSFYKYIVPQVGWNKYNCVNLKYKGQIICTKN